MSIPKVVHAVWIGGSVPPSKEARLLELNGKFFSGAGYSYKVWGDDDINSLFSDAPILKAHFDYIVSSRKFAFASDIIKSFVLKNFGGWVSDADNEFFKSPDIFSGLNWVSGFENFHGQYHPITAVMGAVKDHKFSGLLLDTYLNNPVDAIISHTNTSWISDYLLRHGGNRENKRFYSSQYDVDIFPSEYFCGPEKNENTISHHLFSGSWLKK